VDCAVDSRDADVPEVHGACCRGRRKGEEMKLHITPNEFGPKFTCIDDDYDGAPDAGRQLIGEGSTEQEAKDDYTRQWMEREADRDCKRAVQNMKVFDGMLDSLFKGIAK
jgi:hypothetical protein